MAPPERNGPAPPGGNKGPQDLPSPTAPGNVDMELPTDSMPEPAATAEAASNHPPVSTQTLALDDVLKEPDEEAVNSPKEPDEEAEHQSANHINIDMSLLDEDAALSPVLDEAAALNEDAKRASNSQQASQPSNATWMEMRKFYFRYFDVEESGPARTLMAEAVLAYDAIEEVDRESDSARDAIRSVSSTLKLEDVAKEWNMLCEHKSLILNSIRELLKKPAFGQEQNKKAAYSTIKISGQKDQKEVCFVPDGVSVSPATVAAEILSKKGWRLTKPNMLLRIDCGSRHPTALATPELIKAPTFKTIRTAAELAVSQHQNKNRSEFETHAGPGTSAPPLPPPAPPGRSNKATKGLGEIPGPPGTPVAPSTRAQEQINDHLKVCLQNEILPAIIDAAHKTSNWIVIDRSNSTASSATAELMLENSLSKAEKKPTVVVLDSITRYESFKPSRMVNMQLLELCLALSHAESFGEARQTSNTRGLYAASDFDCWEPYHILDPDNPLLIEPEEGQVKEAEQRKNLLREGDRRLPRKPEDAMINVDENGRKMRCADQIRPLITKEVKWLYHYRQYLFNAGSHYVIFENASESVFAMESNGSPWREGCIFANGGNLSFDRLQTSLSSGAPTVMLYNTGGVAQTFASLYHWCVTCNNVIQEYCFQNKCDPKLAILSRTDVVSTEPWTKKFGISTVSQLQNLAKRAPEHLRRSVVVVDVLQDNPEQVVDKITGCFGSGEKGLPELGLGSAEEDVVLHAWKTHMTFSENAYKFRVWGDIFFYFSLSLTLVSAFVAVLITSEEHTDEIQKGLAPDLDLVTVLKRLLLIIPITTSVLAGITGKKRFIQKWAALKTASAQIVCEIYMFRLDVCDYDPHWQPDNENEEDEDEKGNNENGGGETGTAFNPREVFVQRFQDISKLALDSVGEASLKLSSASRLDFRIASEKQTFQHQLKKYVPKEVLGVSDFPKLKGRCSRRRSTKPIYPGDEEDAKAEAEMSKYHDDYVSPMTIETYNECRAKLLLRLMENITPPLAKRLSDLETLVMLIGAVGTLLAAIDMARWVAITVAAGTSVVNVMQHEMLQQRLHSTNSAQRELTNNQILMDSLSVVSKRTQEMKGRCVNTVETAILETVTAWTGMTARPSVQVSESKKGK